MALCTLAGSLHAVFRRHLHGVRRQRRRRVRRGCIHGAWRGLHLLLQQGRAARGVRRRADERPASASGERRMAAACGWEASKGARHATLVLQQHATLVLQHAATCGWKVKRACTGSPIAHASSAALITLAAQEPKREGQLRPKQHSCSRTTSFCQFLSNYRTSSFTSMEGVLCYVSLFNIHKTLIELVREKKLS